MQYRRRVTEYLMQCIDQGRKIGFSRIAWTDEHGQADAIRYWPRTIGPKLDHFNFERVSSLIKSSISSISDPTKQKGWFLTVLFTPAINLVNPLQAVPFRLVKPAFPWQILLRIGVFRRRYSELCPVHRQNGKCPNWRKCAYFYESVATRTGEPRKCEAQSFASASSLSPSAYGFLVNEYVLLAVKEDMRGLMEQTEPEVVVRFVACAQRDDRACGGITTMQRRSTGPSAMARPVKAQCPHCYRAYDSPLSASSNGSRVNSANSMQRSLETRPDRRPCTSVLQRQSPQVEARSSVRIRRS